MADNNYLQVGDDSHYSGTSYESEAHANTYRHGLIQRKSPIDSDASKKSASKKERRNS